MKLEEYVKYTKIGETGIQVSMIGIGTWGIGGGTLWSDFHVNLKELQKMLDMANERGVNYIDTAPVYGVGNSERLLGESIKGKRNRYILQTKCALNWRKEGGRCEYVRDGITVYRDLRARAIRKDLEDSLRRLQTDYIDILVVHRQSSSVPIYETMQELMKMKREGKIREIGISNASPEDLEEYEKWGNVGLVQEKYSILDTMRWEKFKEICRKTNTIFQGFGLLEQGALTGVEFYHRVFDGKDIRKSLLWNEPRIKNEMLKMLKKWEYLSEIYHCSISSLVLAWSIRQFVTPSFLVGFRRVETMNDSLGALDIVLTLEDERQMEKDAKKFRELFECQK